MLDLCSGYNLAQLMFEDRRCARCFLIVVTVEVGVDFG